MRPFKFKFAKKHVVFAVVFTAAALGAALALPRLRMALDGIPPGGVMPDRLLAGGDALGHRDAVGVQADPPTGQFASTQLWAGTGVGNFDGADPHNSVPVGEFADKVLYGGDPLGHHDASSGGTLPTGQYVSQTLYAGPDLGHVLASGPPPGQFSATPFYGGSSVGHFDASPPDVPYAHDVSIPDSVIQRINDHLKAVVWTENDVFSGHPELNTSKLKVQFWHADGSVQSSVVTMDTATGNGAYVQALDFQEISNGWDVLYKHHDATTTHVGTKQMWIWDGDPAIVGGTDFDYVGEPVRAAEFYANPFSEYIAHANSSGLFLVHNGSSEVQIGTGSDSKIYLITDNGSLGWGGTSGAYAIWGVGGQVRATRMDATGVIVSGWTGTNGIAIESMANAVPTGAASDPSGNLIVSYLNTATHLMYAQKLGPDGSKLWGVNGVLVADGAQAYNFNPDDPYNSTLPDSSNGIIISWLDSTGGRDAIRVQRLDTNGNRVWNPLLDPNPGILVDGTAQYTNSHYQMTTDSRGGAVFAYYAESGTAPLYKVFRVGFVMSSGIIPYGGPFDVAADTTVVGQATIANFGQEVFVAWRADPVGVSTPNIYGQKFSLTDAPVLEHDVSVTKTDILEKGGKIIAWTEHAVYADHPELNTSTIKYMVIGIDGNGAYAGPVDTAQGADAYSEVIQIRNDTGPWFMMFKHHGVDGDYIKEAGLWGGPDGTKQDVINNVDADGASFLLANGVLTTYSNNGLHFTTAGWGDAPQSDTLIGTGTTTRPILLDDGANGAYVVWSVGNRVCASRIFGLGGGAGTIISGWEGENGVAVEASRNAIPTGAVKDAAGNLLVSYLDTTNHVMYAQKINPSGVVQWGTDGVLVADGTNASTFDPSEHYHATVSDGGNGLIISWLDSAGGNPTIRVQRINASGNREWGPAGANPGTKVNDNNDTITDNYDVTSDGLGGAVFVYHDQGATNDVRLAYVDSFGTVSFGGPATIAAAAPVGPVAIAGSGTDLTVSWMNESTVAYYGDRYTIVDTPPSLAYDETVYGSAISAIGDGGTKALVWTEQYNFPDHETANQQVLKYRILNADGTPMAGPFTIDTSRGPNNFTAAIDLKADRDQWVLVYKHSGEDGDYISAQGLWNDGNKWWGESGAHLVNNTHAERVAMYTDNSWTIYFTYGDDTGFYVARSSFAGLPTNITRIGTGCDTRPYIVDGGVPNIYVTWGFEGHVHATHIDGDGNFMAGWDGQADGLPVQSAHNAIPTGAAVNAGNDLFVSYLNTDDHKMYAQKFNASGVARWGTDGVLVADGDASGFDPASPLHSTVAAGTDGVIVSWIDSSDANPSLRAERLDGSGNRLWMPASGPDRGVLINDTAGHALSGYDLADDGFGGAVFVYVNNNTGFDELPVYDYKLAYLNSLGAIAYGGSVELDNSLASDRPSITRQDRKIFVTWMGSYNVDPASIHGDGYTLPATGITPGYDVTLADASYQAMGIDGTKAIVWTERAVYNNRADLNTETLKGRFFRPDGTALTDPFTIDSATGNGAFSEAVDFNYGMATGDAWVVAFKHHDASGSYISVQQLNTDGAFVWPNNGYHIADNTNGAYVSVHVVGYANVSVTSDDGNGGLNVTHLAWNSPNYVTLIGTGTASKPYMVESPGSGVYVVWTQNGQVHMAGTSFWSADGLPDTIIETHTPAVALGIYKDQHGNVLVPFLQTDDHTVHLQKTDPDENLLWGANGKLVADGAIGSAYDPAQKYQTIVGDGVDGSDGAIVSWLDASSGNATIRTQRFDSNGNRLWGVGNSNRGTKVNNTDDALAVDYDMVNDGFGGAAFIYHNEGITNDARLAYVDANGGVSYGGPVTLAASAAAGPVGLARVGTELFSDWMSGTNAAFYGDEYTLVGPPTPAYDLSILGSATPAEMGDGTKAIVWTEVADFPGYPALHTEKLKAKTFNTDGTLRAGDITLDIATGDGAVSEYVNFGVSDRFSVLYKHHDVTGTYLATQRFDADVNLEYGGNGVHVVDNIDLTSAALLPWYVEGPFITYSNNGLYLTHVNGGSIAWTTQIGAGADRPPRIVNDNNGAVYAAWTYNGRLRAIRVDAGTGAIQSGWDGGDGVAVQLNHAAFLSGLTLDGAGDPLIAFVNTDDHLVYAQKLDPSGSRLWTDDGKLVADGANASAFDPTDQFHSTLSDGFGGMIVSWLDSSGARPALRAQRLDAEGVRKWGAATGTNPGIEVNNDSDTVNAAFDMTNDGTGGAIFDYYATGATNDLKLAYVDATGAVSYGGPATVAADTGVVGRAGIYRDGRHLFATWTAIPSGASLANIYGEYYLLPLSDAGNLIRYIDQPPKLAIGPGGERAMVWSEMSWHNNDHSINNNYLYLGLYGASGNAARTGSGKIQIDSAAGDSTVLSKFIDVVGDGTGFYVLIDHQDASGAYEAIQKFSATGAPLWGDHGVRVKNDLNNNTYAWDSDTRLVPDGNGGVYTTEDGLDFRVVRVTVNGSLAFGPTGIKIGDARSDVWTRRTAATDGHGGIVVVWHDGTSSRMRLSRINAAGNIPAAFDPGNGLLLAEPKGSNWHDMISAIVNPDGSIILVYYTYSGTVNVRKLTADGTDLWGNGQVILTNVNCCGLLGQYPKAVSDGAGGVIVGAVTYNNAGLAFQRIDATGKLSWGTIKETPLIQDLDYQAANWGAVFNVDPSIDVSAYYNNYFSCELNGKIGDCDPYDANGDGSVISIYSLFDSDFTAHAGDKLRLYMPVSPVGSDYRDMWQMRADGNGGVYITYYDDHGDSTGGIKLIRLDSSGALLPDYSRTIIDDTSIASAWNYYGGNGLGTVADESGAFASWATGDHFNLHSQAVTFGSSPSSNPGQSAPVQSGGGGASGNNNSHPNVNSNNPGASPVEPGTDSVTFHFTNPGNANTFNLYDAPSGSSPHLVATSNDPAATSITETGLQPNTSYTDRVLTAAANGTESLPSPPFPAFVTLLPNPEAVIAIYDPATKTVTLTGSGDLPNLGVGQSGLDFVVKDQDGKTIFGSGFIQTPGTGAVAGMESGKTYTVTVTARNSAGNLGLPQDYSVTVPTTGPGQGTITLTKTAEKTDTPVVNIRTKETTNVTKEVKYLIVATNKGAVIAKNLVVTDLLPAGIEFKVGTLVATSNPNDPEDAAQASYDPVTRTIKATARELEPTESFSISFIATPSAGTIGSVKNKATVTWEE